MGRKRGSHCRQRCGPELGIFTKNFAESSNARTNRQHRIEGAASNQLVMGSDLDLLEARSFQNPMHSVRVCEREWAGRLRVASGRWRQIDRRGPERHDVEGILLKRAPADERQSPIRLDATTDVAERRRGVGEERHPKPRKSDVERGRFEREYLCVRMDEPHSFAPVSRAFRKRQHRSRQIDPHDFAVRRDGPGEVQRCLASATAYVQDVLTRIRCKRLQSPPTKGSELQFQ